MMKLGEREEEQNEMTLIAGVYGTLRKPIVQTSPTILHHPNEKAMVKNSLTAKKIKTNNLL